ncbi:hypothetical protein K7432_008096 [Basidiobolus ranarum]|uniref:RBR-type E3 ubiquitin transferase n=1 Tax=Basidiobolus ranarum TaxID=34480 RepID=A0ABR2VZ44_9FUNG
MNDLESFRLVIKLIEEDLNNILSSTKGKGKVPESDDLLIELLEYDLARMKITCSDMVMARSLELADEADGPLLDAFAQIEMAEARDREVATLFSQDQIAKPSLNNKSNPSINLEMAFSTLEKSLIQDTNEASTKAQEGSSKSLFTCISCMEEKVDLYHFPYCHHGYCTHCLSRLFRAATKDDSLLPVRCCNNVIDSNVAHQVLSNNYLQEYLQAWLEFSTEDKLYCPTPTCSKFNEIPSRGISDGCINCKYCGCKICITCKNYAHVEEDCPEDLGTKTVLDLASQQHWQRCTKCRNLVELRSGCYHITCTCGNEFCYLCGTRWKGCQCRNWDEGRLLDVAHARLEAANPNLRGCQLHFEINRLAVQLRDHEDCQHNWEHRDLRRMRPCGYCADFLMTNYCFQCQNCLIQVCFVCRYHRIRTRTRTRARIRTRN